jgi:hypothetical protein
MFFDEVLHHERDVFLPLPQGGEFQGEAVDSKEKVLPEFPFLHELGEVAVGGGDQAHIHFDHLVRAQGANFSFLEGTEKFRLHGKRHVGDLVQKQGAAACLFEEADAIAIRVGEGPFFMAKKLAF